MAPSCLVSFGKQKTLISCLMLCRHQCGELGLRHLQIQNGWYLGIFINPFLSVFSSFDSKFIALIIHVQVNRIRCAQCKNISQREEEYLGLPVRLFILTCLSILFTLIPLFLPRSLFGQVTVQGCSTLHQALSRSCALEHFSGSNLYRCSMGCGNQKTEASRSSVFRSLPPVLMLNLNRFTWNEMYVEKFNLNLQTHPALIF